MRILVVLIIVAGAGAALFALPKSEDPTSAHPGPDIRTPEEIDQPKINNHGSSEIKPIGDNEGPKIIEKPPEIAITPDHLLHGTSKNGEGDTGELKLFFPREMKPRNGILVVVPTSMNAIHNIKFNPLKREYKATWVVRLWRIPDNKEMSNPKLPRGNYDVLLYRNDGNKDRAPTRVGAYETSTGSAVDIEQSHLDKIGLK